MTKSVTETEVKGGGGLLSGRISCRLKSGLSVTVYTSQASPTGPLVCPWARVRAAAQRGSPASRLGGAPAVGGHTPTHSQIFSRVVVVGFVGGTPLKRPFMFLTDHTGIQGSRGEKSLGKSSCTEPPASPRCQSHLPSCSWVLLNNVFWEKNNKN